MRLRRPALFACLAITLAAGCIVSARAAAPAAAPTPADAAVDPSLPDYVPQRQVAGHIAGLTGMDTVEGMMGAWSEAFRGYEPDARVTLTLRDGLAPEDRIALGAKTGEVFHPTDLEYENAYGYEPFRIRMCAAAFILKSHVSAIGVYVNKDNPLGSISLAELDAVFSAERRRGYPADIATWGQLGLAGRWAEAPIHLYGFYWRDDVTDYFRHLVTLDAPFKAGYRIPGGDSSRRTPSVAAAIMAAMAEDPYGITFGNGSYMSDGVKALGLSVHGVQSQFTPGDVASGRYPLERYLYLYVNRPPGVPLDPLIGEFLRFVLSRQGQALVSRDHYLPLPAGIASEERAKLND